MGRRVKRGHFAWEYKGKHANLDVAFDQLRQYALALENPPLLIVSDMARFRIRTNWTNSVSETHEFGLEDLTRADVRNLLKWAMSEPERLRPGVTRQTLTERTATTFANLAQTLRQRGEEPRIVAQFVNRLVFCMFAEDVDLLPDSMFTRMLEQAVQAPDRFVPFAQQLFRAMAEGSEVGFESVAWFNGGLFDDDTALPLEKAEIATVLETATLDWADIDPAILGTLFERGLDPDKRSQLGAHYTDRDMIMRIIEPVVTAPGWRSGQPPGKTSSNTWRGPKRPRRPRPATGAAGRRTGHSTRFWNASGSSRFWTRRADPATSSIWPSMPSRIWNTSCSWRRRPWGWNRDCCVWLDPKTSRALRSILTPPNWPRLRVDREIQWMQRNGFPSPKIQS